MPPSDTREAAPADTLLLRTFVEEVFEPLQRADQRRWARAYLSGLLSVSGKKTLQRLAKAVSPGPAASHGLQQFINASPWDWTPVRQCLARAVAARTAPRAWSVAELVIPKRGEHSVGVHRRFDADSGRTINCQLALGLFLCAESCCVPVDWSLVLGDSWCRDEQRRRRARIPESVSARPAWAHILDFATAVSAHPGLAAVPWAVDLRRTPVAGAVVAGLARRGLDFVCEVGPGQPVVPPSTTAPALGIGEVMARGQARQPHLAVRQQTPLGRPELTTVHSAPVRLPVQEGTPEPLASRRYRALMHPAAGARQGARYWITSFTDRRVDEVLALARHAPASAAAVADMEAHFGVQDFEGRSYPGWHHHMTMSSAAYAFRQLCARAGDGAVPSRPVAGSSCA
ncbi:hypothetical protein GCM10027168_16950 [Streptomyces capparidis]